MQENIINVYGQEAWHTEAKIVANREGLELLKQAIDKAIANSFSAEEVLASDGEGYKLTVICLRGGLDNKDWQCYPPEYKWLRDSEQTLQAKKPAVDITERISEVCKKVHEAGRGVLPPQVCRFCFKCPIAAIVVGASIDGGQRAALPIPEAEVPAVLEWLSKVEQQIAGRAKRPEKGGTA